MMNQKKLKDNTNRENIYKGSIDCFKKVKLKISFFFKIGSDPSYYETLFQFKLVI